MPSRPCRLSLSSPAIRPPASHFIPITARLFHATRPTHVANTATETKFVKKNVRKSITPSLWLNRPNSRTLHFPEERGLLPSLSAMPGSSYSPEAKDHAPVASDASGCERSLAIVGADANSLRVYA